MGGPKREFLRLVVKAVNEDLVFFCRASRMSLVVPECNRYVCWLLLCSPFLDDVPDQGLKPRFLRWVSHFNNPGRKKCNVTKSEPSHDLSKQCSFYIFSMLAPCILLFIYSLYSSLIYRGYYTVAQTREVLSLSGKNISRVSTAI